MKIGKIMRQIINGTVYLQAPLKAYELDDRILKEKYGILVKKMDYDNDSDIGIWMSIIHASYDDCSFTMQSARDFLKCHPYMINTQSFVFLSMHTNTVVATVSTGIYKANPSIGGDFRIGVIKGEQNKGYGRLCILYAFSKLASMGIKNGESAIAFKRKESLNLHFSLGFRPQYNARYLAEQHPHVRMKNLNIILNVRLYLSYHRFLRREKGKYIIK